MRGPALLALILACLSAAAGAEPVVPDQKFAGAVERAIVGGRLIQAEAMLQKPGIDLGHADGRYLTALLALAQHHDGDAAVMFESLLVDHAGDCRFLAGAGIAALRRGRDELAGHRLEGAVAACPGRGEAWEALGILHDRAGRWDKSAEAYRRALALDAENPALLNNAGVSFLAQKRPAEAAGLFRQALALEPRDRRAANNLDIARVMLGERPMFEDDKDSTNRAARLNNAGYAALASGDDAAASRYFREAIKQFPFRFDTAEANLGRLAEKGADR